MTRLFRFLLLPLLLLSLLARPASAEDAASAYQLNPTHTGAISTPNLTPPLVKAWSVNLGGKVSYPLIARGKVFVTVGNSYPDGYGTKLYALNAQTGQIAWGPKTLPATYYWSNAAYDGGRVFVIDYDGVLRAYNADTGAYLWHKKMPFQYAFSSPPSAHNGVVYVGGSGSGGTLYAVKEATGQILWTAGVENGDNSSPVVASDGVYVSYAGQQTYKFDPLSGSLLWHYDSGEEGAAARPPCCTGGGCTSGITRCSTRRAAPITEGLSSAAPTAAFSVRLGRVILCATRLPRFQVASASLSTGWCRHRTRHQARPCGRLRPPRILLSRPRLSSTISCMSAPTMACCTALT